MRITETKNFKLLASSDINSIFDKRTGFFARWGVTKQDDPEFNPYGNEILDIEVSTICHQACPFCYKSNTAKGENMTFDTFKTILDKMPPTLTQIAIGIGSVDSNPDLFKMMRYSRNNSIIPNITINGYRMTSDLYDKLADVCGAVAVSNYDKDVCYDAVKELTDRGLKQVNIHQLLAEETYDQCMTILDDRNTDARLANLNAVVFLWLKPKGKRNEFRQLGSMDKFKTLINKAFNTGGKFGFDSCSASNFLKSVGGDPNFEQYKVMAESCESTCFSYYINTLGIGFPCSFSENTPDYRGVDVVGCEDFIRDVWNAEETKKFRNRVIANKDCNGCRMCPVYKLEI